MSKYYQFTLNQTERLTELTQYLTSLKNLVYGYAAVEFAPSTGHAHIHGWVKFSSSTRLSIRRCEGAHVEPCKAGAIKNLQYVTLEGSKVWEYGDIDKLHLKGAGSDKAKSLVELLNEDKIKSAKRKADMIYWHAYKGSNDDMAVECLKHMLYYYKKEDIGEWDFNDPILKLPDTKYIICRNFSSDKCCKAVWEYLIMNYKEIHLIIDHWSDLPKGKILFWDQWEWEEPLQRAKEWYGIPDESDWTED